MQTAEEKKSVKGEDMTKTGKPLCKQCRKAEEKLYLKGIRCEGAKCPIESKAKKGRGKKFYKKKISEYGMQLKEKNKVKIFYGMLEKQFRKYFEMAKKSKGVTGEILLQFLERRLDNVVYKLKWTYSKRMSKQLVTHGSIFINGKKLDRPGYLVKIGDEIQIKPNSKCVKTVKECIESKKNSLIPLWLELDEKELKARALRVPGRDEVSISIDEQAIVNLYSK